MCVYIYIRGGKGSVRLGNGGYVRICDNVV